MSAARQGTHISMTATEYDLQFNYRHVSPVTGTPQRVHVNLKIVSHGAAKPELL